MSSNIVYTQVSDYLQSCTRITARINALENILDQMLVAMDKATRVGHFEEVKLDTGQTVTEIKYRSLNEIMASYNILVLRLDREYAKLGNRINGRTFRLVDAKNFRSRI